MSNPLVLYTNPMSRGGIIRWMLEEVGAPYEIVNLDYGPAMKSADYLAINPMGKVPALKHGDQVVTEAAAICAYLADAFPEAGLAPPLDKRAEYYRWLFFAAGPVEAALGIKMCGFTLTPQQEGQLGCGNVDVMVNTLAQAVEGKRYIANDQFTAADVYVGAHIGWGMQFGSLEKRPEFVTYYAGLSERPAHQRSMGAAS